MVSQPVKVAAAIRRIRRLAVGMSLMAVLVLVLVLGARFCPAQSIGVDPYDPWNSIYHPFQFPSAPLTGLVPNGARMGIVGFGDRGPDPEVSPFTAPFSFQDPTFPGSSRFTPYYNRGMRGYRPYRSSQNPTDTTKTKADVGSRGRDYVANRNDTFFQDQEDRERRFFEALRERDPQKRSEALRQLDKERQAALKSSRVGPARKSSTPVTPSGPAAAAAALASPPPAVGAPAAAAPPLPAADPILSTDPLLHLDALPGRSGRIPRPRMPATRPGAADAKPGLP